MFILTATRLLSGYVKFHMMGGFPERFFNLCAANKRAVWDMVKVEDGYEAFLLAQDYKRLRQTAKSTGVRMKVLEKHGLPFFVRRYRFRPGMVAGAAIFGLTIAFLSLFIWNVNIVGINSLTEEELLPVLRQNGVYEGARSSQIDPDNIIQDIILAKPEIAWMSINVHGTSATVEISERTYAPERVDAEKPCNIKAAADGRIVNMQVLAGKEAVQKGDAVVKGDLLVSGTVEYSNGTTVLKHAAAIITAQTERSLTVTVPRHQTVKRQTGRVMQKSVLHFFHMDLPLYLGSVRGTYEKKIEKKMLALGGAELPIGLTTATFYETVPLEVDFKTEELLEQARKQRTEAEKKELDGAKIISFEEKVEETEQELVLTTKYFCEENIAIEEEILIFPS